MQIGERLKEERKRLGLSQARLCELMGISRKTLFSYETGKRSPTAVFLATLYHRGIHSERLPQKSGDSRNWRYPAHSGDSLANGRLHRNHDFGTAVFANTGHIAGRFCRQNR